MAKRSTGRLAEYGRKRDFAVTPEPAPDSAPTTVPGQAPRFMVHKHDATRLHYDLRLEMDGALASWAIPKGLSYDPAAKRLAVQTEDHPLQYANFEGRIPDGEYGAGDSLIWDQGTYDTVPPGQASAQRTRGRMLIELHGEKLKGRWHLVRTRAQGKKEQWLIFKAKDGTEDPSYDVVAARPESVVSGRKLTRGPVRSSLLHRLHPPAEALLERVWPPMRATLAKPDAAPAEKFRYEVKYDGYRGLAALSGGKLCLRTRNALDLSTRFPDIARALTRIRVGEAVLDGEVVAVDAKGVSHFQGLMAPGAEHRYQAFDLLWLEGQDLRGRPIEDRRELLESLLANVPPPLFLAEQVEAPSVQEALWIARRYGWEGLVAKRRGSAYVGTRSADWLKLKLSASQEVAIIGYTPISNGSDQIGALLVAVHGPDGFHYAGKVGTGFTAKVRRDLRAKLERDRVPKSSAVDAPRMRDAIWVEPRWVAQVAFSEWTADGRLRHPSFQGLRLDKRPEECVRESAAAAPDERAGQRGASQSVGSQKGSIHAPTLTHPDKVLFPEAGWTKKDVFAYYRAVSKPVVEALKDRPIALEQWPAGIGKPGFFRQQVRAAPPWVTTVELPHQDRSLRHLVVDRPETLLWLANQSALTLHLWNGRVEQLDEPDWVVFDLDPPQGRFSEAVEIALALRGLLEQLNLASVPKTSGKRGLHVFVPLARGHTQEDALNFAVAVTRVLEQGLKDRATTERSLKKRGDRLYLDAYQNGKGKTVVAPYSLRAVPEATVSTPLQWSEVHSKLDPSAFTLKTVPGRLEELGDLFAPALRGAQRLPRLA